MSSAEYLPFWKLRDLIGHDAAAALLSAHGGGRLYIPARPEPDEPLVKAVGMDAARQLASYVVTGETGRGGGVIELPSRVPIRDPRLDFMQANPGLSERELAKALGIGGRTVRRLRARLAARPSAFPSEETRTGVRVTAAR